MTESGKSGAGIGLKSNVAITQRGVDFDNHNASEFNRKEVVVWFTDELNSIRT